jgi:hypothetical protein
MAASKKGKKSSQANKTSKEDKSTATAKYQQIR